MLSFPARCARLLCVLSILLIAGASVADDLQHAFEFSADELVLVDLVGEIQVEAATGDRYEVEVVIHGDDAEPGLLDVVLTEGLSEQLLLIEASAADTYELFQAEVPLAGRSVSVHGIETGDANGDGLDEAYIANLQGAVWVVSTEDVSTFTSDDIYLIALDTLAQFLETGFGSLTPAMGKTANAGVDFVIAGSNDSNARDYQYIGGPGGDPTDPEMYNITEVISPDDFVNVVPGGIRVYGLDLGGDMDGDGVPEIVFSRGSTRGGDNAPALLVLEIAGPFNQPTDPPTVAVDLDELPGGFALQQNYPNPFNPTTSITFSLAEPGHVNLSVYNSLGQQVAQLVNGVKTADTHIVDWNALSDSGQQLPSGIYIYRIDVNDKAKARSMVLMK